MADSYDPKDYSAGSYADIFAKPNESIFTGTLYKKKKKKQIGFNNPVGNASPPPGLFATRGLDPQAQGAPYMDAARTRQASEPQVDHVAEFIKRLQQMIF